MRSQLFAATGTGVIVNFEAGKKLVFYGCEFCVTGAPVPTSIQFADFIANPLTPDMNGLTAGVLHRLAVNYSPEGFPVPRGVGAAEQGAGIIVTGGAGLTVRGTFFYEYVLP